MLFIKRRVCLCVRLCLYLWTYVYIVGMQGSTINKYYENKLWNRKNLMNESMKIKFKQKSRQQTFKVRWYQMTEWYKINEWMYVQYISFFLSIYLSFLLFTWKWDMKDDWSFWLFVSRLSRRRTRKMNSKKWSNCII